MCRGGENQIHEKKEEEVKEGGEGRGGRGGGEEIITTH